LAFCPISRADYERCFFALSALLKQQGMGVKGAAKSTPVVEEIPPLLEGGGKLEVIL